MPHRFRAAAAVVILALGAAPAQAQSVRLIGEFNAWSAYAASEGAGALCFALSKPTQVTPTPDGFTEAWLYLTQRSAEGVRNEFNLVAGFTFAPDSQATASISGQSFPLFTERDAAWLLDPAQAESLAAAIRSGSTLIVEGTSDKGIRISETFSLSGATAASRAIQTDC